jgi:hypothetical protein
MRKTWRSLIIISIFLAATLFIGCTDEPDNKDDNNVPDDEDDNDGNISDDDGSGDDDDTPKDPQISGFNFNLETGTFWNYYWKTEDYSWVQGNDPSTDTFIGDFKVELGATVDIEGVNAFVVSTSGDSTDEDFNFAPAWTHLAVNGNQLLSSSDGLTLQVIFDGMTGKWTGGGFFTSFPDDTEITAKSGQISNEYIETSAYSVGRSDSSSGTVYIPETGETIDTGDDDITYNENEYYKGSLGPIGYYYYYSYSSDGGGFYTSFSTKRIVGLVDTTLTADDGFAPKLPPWVRKSDMPVSRNKGSASAVNDIIYLVGGGETRVDAYDPATDTWSEKSPMPLLRYETSSAAVNDKIYVFGSDGKRVDVYDPSMDSWTAAGDMPREYDYVRCVAVGDQIVLMGDTSSKWYDPNIEVQIYTPAEDKWELMGTLPSDLERTAFALAAVDSYVFVIGGYNGDIDPKQMLRYHAGTDVIEEEGWLNEARSFPTAASAEGEIFAIGGHTDAGYKDVVESYDLSSPETYWTQRSPMSTPRSHITCTVVDDIIYVFGGQNNDQLTLVEKYDPAADVEINVME